MRRVIAAILCLVCGACGIEGLHNANPKLSMRLNPATGNFDLSSNRDDDAAVEGLEVQTSSGTRVKLDKAQFKGDASSVREANLFQMQGMALQATANWAGAVNMIGAVGDALTEVLPYVPPIVASRALGRLPRSQAVTTPWGQLQTGTGFTDSQVAALLQIAGSQAPAARQAPATQPAPAPKPASSAPTLPEVPVVPPTQEGLEFGSP